MGSWKVCIKYPSGRHRSEIPPRLSWSSLAKWVVCLYHQPLEHFTSIDQSQKWCQLIKWPQDKSKICKGTWQNSNEFVATLLRMFPFLRSSQGNVEVPDENNALPLPLGTGRFNRDSDIWVWYLVCEIVLTNAFKKHVTLHAKRILQFKQPSWGLHDTLSRLRVS